MYARLFVLLLIIATLLVATQLQSQTLPVVGQVLWKIDYPKGSPTGAIAYAPDVNIESQASTNSTIPRLVSFICSA